MPDPTSQAKSLYTWLRSPSHHGLLALLYGVGLELLIVFHQWIWVVAGVLLALMVYGVALVRFEERGAWQIRNTVLPVLAALGFMGFIIFMPSGAVRQVYIVASAVTVYWLLRHASREAYPTWNWTLTTLVLLLNIAVLLALHDTRLWPSGLTLPLSFVISLLLTAQGLSRVVSTRSRTLLVSLAIALVLTELLWTLLFLPIHFLVQAGIVATAFYVAFHLVSLSYEHKLARSHIMEYVSFGVVLLTILVMTAHWF